MVLNDFKWRFVEESRIKISGDVNKMFKVGFDKLWGIYYLLLYVMFLFGIFRVRGRGNVYEIYVGGM